jgi:hypothetical protein
MDNKMIGFGIIGIIVAIALLSAFAPIVADLIYEADNNYQCQNSAYQVMSRDQLLCTNASYVCTTALPVFVPPNLCTNASGVAIVNATATSGFSIYNESSTDIGISGTESSMMSLIMLFVVLGILFAVAYPLLKKNN